MKPQRRPTTGSKRQRPSATQGEAGLDKVMDPVDLARLTLQSICKSDAPAAARAQAARTLLELAGALRSGVDNSRKISSEMTLEEIDERLRVLTVTDTPSQTR